MDDEITRYEIGLKCLLALLESSHGRYAEAKLLAQELRETITARPASERARKSRNESLILERLNQFALDTLSISFDQLCGARPDILPDFMTSTLDERHELHELLHRYFILDEIEQLSYSLKTNYEIKPGNRLETTARELIEHLERRGRIFDLIAALFQLRPNIREKLLALLHIERYATRRSARIEAEQAVELPSSISPVQPALAAFPPASPWLASHGFLHDPCAFRDAETMAPEIREQMLEDTFVDHPNFDQRVMDLNSSTVLVASRGSGKTAGRLWLAGQLDKRCQRSLNGQMLNDGSPSTPLVVTYKDFGDVRLQGHLCEHEQPLLMAISEGICAFMIAYPHHFMDLDDTPRDWWWAFLNVYMRGMPLEYRLPKDLSVDFQRKTERGIPFYPGSSLAQMLEHIQDRCVSLGIDRLFILVDGFDGTQSYLELLVAPLLNDLRLLSLPRVIWKFFLPDVLSRAVSRAAGLQTGRLHMVPIEWDAESLKIFLQRRLEWAGGISDIGQLCDQDLLRANVEGKPVLLEEELIEMALRDNRFGKPRALLNWLDELQRFKGTRMSSADATLLSLNDWMAFKQQVRQEES